MGAPYRLAVHRDRPPGGAARVLRPGRQPAAAHPARTRQQHPARPRRPLPARGGWWPHPAARTAGVSGSQRTPRAARACGGASAAHSPTAVNNVAPASTAATAAINNDVRLCRTPRRFRRSGTRSRYSARPEHWPGSSARSLAGRRESCSRAALTGDDDKAGTVFRSDRWIRHPHDLGTLPAPHPGERTRLPVINKPSRHYAETPGSPVRRVAAGNRHPAGTVDGPDRGPAAPTGSPV
jgi:hypothetical protein